MLTWFERNTHSAEEWTLESLVAAKAGHRVSLVVPARNEAATVGHVVTRARQALMETAALVDEIVRRLAVLSSAQGDRTTG